MATGAAAPKGLAQGLFPGLAGGYEARATVLSLGLEPGWKDMVAARVPVAPGGVALDVCAGTAAISARVAERWGCRVVGIDQSPEMLAAGRERVAERGLEDRIELRQGEAESLPFPDATFDALTVSYLLRYVDDPPAVLRELVRVLKPGAPFAHLEFGMPRDPVLRLGWRVYAQGLMPVVGLAVGGRAWWRAGRVLATTIPALDRRYPDAALGDLHREAGLAGVRVERPGLGAAVVVSGRRA